MIFWLILLAVLLLAGMKVAKEGKWQEDFLSLNQTKKFQGFCIIAIILHHFTQNLMYHFDGAGILNCMENVGVLFVGFFFFCSGYGLMTSLRQKEGYLKGFLRKRLPSILFPFYIGNAVFLLVTCFTYDSFYYLFDASHTSLLTAVLSFLGFYFINPQTWYIIALTIFYTIFYLCFRFIKKEKISFIVLGIVLIVYVCVCMCLGHGNGLTWLQGEWWYNTTFLFYFGLLFARFKDKLVIYAQKNYTKLTFSSVCFWALSFWGNLMALSYISYYGDYNEIGFLAIAGCMVCFLVQTITVFMFVAMVLLISMKIRFSNPILTFLGKICLELYLIHNLFIIGYRSKMVL